MSKAAEDKAIQAYQNADFNKAKAICRRLLQSKKNAAMPHCILGLIALDEDDNQLAINKLKKAVSLEPESFFFRFHLARSYSATGKYEEAVSHYKKALSREAKGEGYANLGATYLRMKEYAFAEENLRRALELNPAQPHAWSNLGLAQKAMKRIDDALDSFTRAIDMAPEFVEAYKNLGELLQQKNHFGEAIAIWKRALEIQPNYIDIHKLLAQLHQHRGDKEKAVEQLERCLEIAPDDEEVKNTLAALGEKMIAPTTESVEAAFDDYAEIFEHHLTGVLNYNVPAKLTCAIDWVRDINDITQFSNALDLGCGTGLMAEHVYHYCDRIVGVDLSAKMLETAGKRGRYHELHKQDIAGFFENDPVRKYDFIAAADVFVYIGDLESIFAEISEHLNPEVCSLFACSVEGLMNESGYKLKVSKRYAHSFDYICAIAQKSGLNLEFSMQTGIRTEGTGTIPGYIFVFSNQPDNVAS